MQSQPSLCSPAAAERAAVLPRPSSSACSPCHLAGTQTQGTLQRSKRGGSASQQLAQAGQCAAASRPISTASSQPRPSRLTVAKLALVAHIVADIKIVGHPAGRQQRGAAPRWDGMGANAGRQRNASAEAVARQRSCPGCRPGTHLPDCTLQQQLMRPYPAQRQQQGGQGGRQRGEGSSGGGSGGGAQGQCGARGAASCRAVIERKSCIAQIRPARPHEQRISPQWGPASPPRRAGRAGAAWMAGGSESAAHGHLPARCCRLPAPGPK